MRERFRGSLLGLAVGDAMGAALEFAAPGTFKPVTDMVGGGPFNLKPGEWTDDTAMALCLAASLTECGFDPLDQMNRYLKWYREGYMSCRGRCIGIGRTVSSALLRFEVTHEPFSGLAEDSAAGNGSIMRLAPVALFYAMRPDLAVTKAALSSLTTHGARAALDACRYLAGLLVGALQGVDKDELLSPRYSPVPGCFEEEPLAPEIDEVALGSFKTKNPPEIRGTGYVVRSLEAALWAFYHSSDFRDGCLLAVNLGDDADTTGAVYGQLAGAYYGEDGIPVKWREMLAWRELIETLAEKLYELAQKV